MAVLFAWLFGAFACVAGCRSAGAPTGGETHFLTTCHPENDTCGDGLTCLCGICTRACENSSQCQSLPLAECVPPESPSACSQPVAHCDVVCNTDEDCRALSDSHRCVLNNCRSGPGASGGTGGTGGTSGGGGAPTCETGAVEPNQVLVIGDSFFAISHQITAYLEQHARDAGVLAAGERYRDNSNTTNNGLAMGGNGILDQYQRGVEESGVAVVVMDGGGVDMLLSSCSAPVDECPALVDAAAGAETLLAEMAADGVSDVVYAFYPDPVDPAMLERMDALRRLIEPVCAASAVPCHWVDLRTTLAVSPDYLSADGLIPTPQGSEVSARAIWETMQRNCVAQ